MTAETGFLETNGARIYYEVEGSGEPVVLIHAGIANLRMWDEQVPALIDRYRIIRYDTRGFGRTESQDVSFSNRADVAAVLDHLGEASAHIVAVSRAAQIALDFTLEFPDRVRSLVFVNGGVSGFDRPELRDDAAWDEPESYEAARDWEKLADWETRFWVDGPGQPPGRAEAAVREQVHDWILTTYRAEKPEGTPQPLDPPAVGRLGEVRVPVLVVVGTVDEPHTQAASRFVAERVAGARLEVFEDAAHMVSMEFPERFNGVLREFLDASSGVGAGAHSATLA